MSQDNQDSELDQSLSIDASDVTEELNPLELLSAVCLMVAEEGAIDAEALQVLLVTYGFGEMWEQALAMQNSGEPSLDLAVNEVLPEETDSTDATESSP